VSKQHSTCLPEAPQNLFFCAYRFSFAPPWKTALPLLRVFRRQKTRLRVQTVQVRIGRKTLKRGAPKGEGSSAQGRNQVPRDQGAISSTGISTCCCSVSNAELTYSNHFRYAPRPHRYLSHWQAGWTFSKWVCIAAFEASSEQLGNSSPCTVNLSSLDVSFDFIHSPDTILIIFA
jgi:hypothetical protein